MELNRFRFGLFEFDVTSKELRREGVLVRLQAQPAQVLACLVRSAGQTVSRDELSKTLWNGETFVDFDRGINFCISQIRSALKDDSSEPTYIQTIPKQGYRFIAPIERMSEVLPGREEMPVPKDRRKRTLLLVTVGVALAATAVTAWALALARQSPILAVLRFDNETGDPGMDRFSDALTDTVVERLTDMSRDHYRVAGNALILRGPRERRDLSAIAKSLHATYIVLGQVQSNNRQVRILAHLIRLPQQTHLRVVRIEATLDDPLRLESEVAQQIAGEFSARITGHGERFTPGPKWLNR